MIGALRRGNKPPVQPGENKKRSAKKEKPPSIMVSVWRRNTKEYKEEFSK